MNRGDSDECKGSAADQIQGCTSTLRANGGADYVGEVPAAAVSGSLTAEHDYRTSVPSAGQGMRNRLDCDLERWFVSAILPHQAALTRYLKRLCKSSSEVPDLRQETYIRVCESATKSRPRFPKTFLFTTARNLVIDKARRERVVSIDYTQDGVSLDLLSVDELTPERRLVARQDLQQVTRAFDSLPEQTRSVIWLRRVAGLSQRDTAASLGIDESALEGRMSRGMRRLAKAVVVNGSRVKRPARET
jgi:RNA polymerase sigma factor (sigma-70 family)